MPVILILDMHVRNKNFVIIFHLTGKCATQKLQNLRSCSLYMNMYIKWSYQEAKIKNLFANFSLIVSL